MAELSVSRKSVGALLSGMQGRRFIVPDYQRPYKWDLDKCETLWTDIVEFFDENPKKGDYFLGTIVTYKNGDTEVEIIDGQQRITSLFLLLRAFYRKLEGMKEDPNIIGLKGQIAPCIWDVSNISKTVTDKTLTHIESRVVSEAEKAIFHAILKDGEPTTGATDLYSENFWYFLKKCEFYAMNDPTTWQQLCVTILDRCIVLPIDCENQEVALTIFTTLNDRGMPLSDSDIFKAQIYRTKVTAAEQDAFIQSWKELHESAETSGISVDDIFRYESHCIRGRAGDRSKEIALRKFYTAAKSARLKEAALMDELAGLVGFWSLAGRLKPSTEAPVITTEALKYIHCLMCYPNEFWKFITSVYVMRNQGDPAFAANFAGFLKRLTAYLFVRYIQKPSVNGIKEAIYLGCIDVAAGQQTQFAMELPDAFTQDISRAVDNKVAKGLILLHAYLDVQQTTLVPGFEIEHIFPKKWQDTNYHGWSKPDAETYLEKFGNKVIIEKKINIQAGNGYFGKKKERYQKSGVASVLALSGYGKNDWTRQDIDQREAAMVSDLLAFFRAHLG